MNCIAQVRSGCFISGWVDAFFLICFRNALKIFISVIIYVFIKGC
jgi:hypothetical protein